MVCTQYRTVGVPKRLPLFLLLLSTLDETSFRDAVCHHFRLPNIHRIHGDMSRCPCGARPDVGHSAPSFAEHAQSFKLAACSARHCSKGLGVGNPRLIRHNLMLPVLEDLNTQMGFEFDCRPAFMRIPGSDSGTGDDKLLQVDFVARGGARATETAAWVSISPPLPRWPPSTSPLPSRKVAHVLNTRPSPFAQCHVRPGQSRLGSK
jgi:hypothetical protein